MARIGPLWVDYIRPGGGTFTLPVSRIIQVDDDFTLWGVYAEHQWITVTAVDLQDLRHGMQPGSELVRVVRHRGPSFSDDYAVMIVQRSQ